jgi:GNAT superfamily N-acetyltransferase
MNNELPVWSLVCFYIAPKFRRIGLSGLLIQEAVKFCRQSGASVLEAYPIAPKKEKMPDVFAYTGLLATFLKCGFKEVLRRSETRPIVRLY